MVDTSAKRLEPETATGRAPLPFILPPMALLLSCLPAALAWQPADPRELPAQTLALLDACTDFTMNFDQPGFYAVLEAVKRNPQPPGHSQTPARIDDWRVLVDRPNDFRGAVVSLTGRLGRNKSPYLLQRRPDLGEITQLELYSDTQPLACTIICTENVADLPIDADIEITGYFVLVRNYKGPGGRIQQSAVIVTPAPTSIALSGPRTVARQFDWRWAAAAVAAAALVVWMAVRRAAAGHGRTDLHTLHARSVAPQTLADDLAAWASSSSDEADEPGNAPQDPARKCAARPSADSEPNPPGRSEN